MAPVSMECSRDVRQSASQASRCALTGHSCYNAGEACSLPSWERIPQMNHEQGLPERIRDAFLPGLGFQQHPYLNDLIKGERDAILQVLLADGVRLPIILRLFLE